MARGVKSSPLMIICLAVFLGAALLLVFFGARMALYRVDQRAVALEATAEVIAIESRTSTDSEGKSSTTYAFDVEFHVAGDPMQRPLISAAFDQERGWFNADEVSPSTYAEGKQIPILVRPDLNFAATPADFWSAYLIPTILMAFGGFITLFLSLWSWLAFR